MHAFTAFGVTALLLQSYQAIWDKSLAPERGGAVAIVVAAGSILFGFLRARPRGLVARSLSHPHCRVEIRPGDIFEQTSAHLVVGFTDVFDTDPSDDRIIHGASIQAQFLRRVYGGDIARLDADLDRALEGLVVVETLAKKEKPFGKLQRYPIGTVAVLGTPQKLYFCLAYSRMMKPLVAQSSGNQLWLSLSRLWAAVHAHAQRGPLCMPVIGANLARVEAFTRDGLLRLILLSFVSASREQLLTTHLQIILPPNEFAELDQLELQAFLDSL